MVTREQRNEKRGTSFSLMKWRVRGLRSKSANALFFSVSWVLQFFFFYKNSKTNLRVTDSSSLCLPHCRTHFWFFFTRVGFIRVFRFRLCLFFFLISSFSWQLHNKSTLCLWPTNLTPVRWGGTKVTKSWNLNFDWTLCRKTFVEPYPNC